MSTDTNKVVDQPAATPAEPAAPELISEQPDNPRLRAEREIAKAAAARRDAEAQERIEGMEPAAPPTTPEPQPEGLATEHVEGAPAAVDGGVEAPADEEVELTIDGKPVKVKASQIMETGRRALQKELAADQRLELATRLLDEATKRAGGQPPSPEGAQPASKPESAAVKEKTDAELAHLLQFGTEEQAATAIAEIRRRDTGAVNQDSLQAFIAKELPAAVSAQLAFHNAVTSAKAEYADIFADPHLTTLFHVSEHRARQAGDARPHSELYKDIGDGIRAHFKTKAPAPTTGPTVEQKKDAKAKAPTVPQLASVRIEQAGPSAKTREEARDEILAKMQRTRGQGSISKYTK